jgi:hypothetical protein
MEQRISLIKLRVANLVRAKCRRDERSAAMQKTDALPPGVWEMILPETVPSAATGKSDSVWPAPSAAHPDQVSAQSRDGQMTASPTPTCIRSTLVRAPS